MTQFGFIHNRQVSSIVIFALLSTVFFQITIYKYLWGLEWLSVFNSILLFVIFYIYSFYIKIFNKKTLIFYIIPSLLVFFSYLFNLTISLFRDVNIINQYGILVPWIIYLSIPAILKSKNFDVVKMWRYFNNFMLGIILISIIEYHLIFLGYINTTPIQTSGGQYEVGYFSVLHLVVGGPSDGSYHYRFYSSFAEPGAVAMFLIPLVSYVFFKGNYISLSVYLYAIYLTDSLGGYISLLLLVLIIAILKFINGKCSKVLFLSILVCLASIAFFHLLERYENKYYSAFSREKAVVNFIKDFPSLVVHYPFGMPIGNYAAKFEDSNFYIGNTFAIGKAYQFGGLLASLGYLSMLCTCLYYAMTSLFRKDLSCEELAVVMSIIPLSLFIFQRSTIWDYSIFPLLFAPFLLYFLKK